MIEILEMIQISEGLKEISLPLKKIGIHTFTVLLNYDDETQINLSNKPNWIKDYYELRLHESSVFDKKYIIPQSGFSLWPNTLNTPVYQHGLVYDSGQGITFYERGEDHNAFYFFSGSNKNAFLMNLIINNLQFLELFVHQFKTNASVLLSTAKKLNYKKVYENPRPHVLSYLKRKEESQDQIAEFKNNLFKLAPTSRQKQVLYWYSKGKTAKETARLLNVSPRTVERHFEELRKKYDNYSKQELIAFFSAYVKF